MRAGNDHHRALESVGSPPGRIFTVRARDGFTLVELLMVMLLMGVLMAIAAPRIDVWRPRVDSAVLQVQMAVAVSRGQAILKQHDLVITFDETRRRLNVLQDANNNNVTDAGEQLTVVQIEEGVTFGRGGTPVLNGASHAISFTRKSEDLPALIFHRNGAASEEGVVYLTSINAGDDGSSAQNTRALVIERSTGRVHCYSYRTLAWKEGC